MKPHHAILCAALLVSAGSAGCMGTTDVVENPQAVADFDISPVRGNLRAGSVWQFTAMMQFADGTRRDVTAEPSTVWSSSDPGIATVSETGMVSALQPGVADISVEYGGVMANEHFAVTP